jgi:hypothetical protein
VSAPRRNRSAAAKRGPRPAGGGAAGGKTKPAKANGAARSAKTAGPSAKPAKPSGSVPPSAPQGASTPAALPSRGPKGRPDRSGFIPRESEEGAAEARPGDIESLIELGRERGYLTYQEVSDRIPQDSVYTDQIDDLLSKLSEMDIEIIDEDDVKAREQDAKPRPRRADGDEAETPEPTESRTDDPVRMYLHEMGQVMLLTRDEEIALAKQVEDGEKLVDKALYRSDLVIKELLQLDARLTSGELSLTDAVKVDGEGELTPQQVKRIRRRIASTLSRVRRLWQQYQKLRDRPQS